jgi:FkbM family methyltransferase
MLQTFFIEQNSKQQRRIKIPFFKRCLNLARRIKKMYDKRILTRKLTNKILNKISSNRKFARVSYSQEAEDLLLAGFLHRVGKESDYEGFYVDVGAHHPFRFSNTAIFYDMGWRGINIEPDSYLIKNFYKYRPRDINLNFGVANEEKDLNFFIFNDPALNTFSEELAKKIDGHEIYKIKEKKIVQVHKLKNLLEKYLPREQKIDFMSIDVEGLDLEVLKSNDWEKFSPHFILVETLMDESDEISKFLNQHNYKFKCCTALTSIYQQSELKSQ